MMRKFKHRTLDWIAEGCFYDKDDTLLAVSEKDNDTAVRAVPKKLIENSQDREEVIEDDWISNAWTEYEECWTTNDDKDFREIIEKHAPKQLKFTIDDVKERYNKQKSYGFLGEVAIRYFLEDHNLLSEEQQWETSE